MMSTTTQGTERRVGAIRRLVALTEAVGALCPVLVCVMCTCTLHKAPMGSSAAFGEMSQ